MPFATDPRRTLPIWLPSDADLPAESRPTFRSRFLTRHEISLFSEELEKIPDAEPDEGHRRLTEILAAGITGWSNMTAPGPDGRPATIDYAPDRFDAVLTPQEKYDLAWIMLRAPRLDAEDKKKSSSAPPSSAASSAPGAGSSPATAMPPADGSASKTS